jgi:hypothetical protein
LKWTQIARQDERDAMSLDRAYRGAFRSLVRWELDEGFPQTAR